MKKFITDSAVTSLGFLLQKPISFVREFVLAGILGPYFMGLRELVIMLMNYSSYGFIGSLVELYRNTSELNRNDNDVEINNIVSTMIVFGLFLSTIISFGLIGYLILTEHQFELQLSFVLLIPLIYFYLVGNVINYYMNGKALFKKATTYEMIFVIVNTLFCIVFAYLFGLVGAVLGLTLAYCVRFILFFHYWVNHFKLQLYFDLQILIRLMKGGFNLFINNISESLYLQVDSLITILMLGPAALGIYGVATKINSLIYSVFNSALNPFEQKMIERSNDAKMKEYLYMVLLLCDYIMVIPILVIVFVSPYLFGWLLPAFLDTSIIILILAPSALFNVVLTPVRGYLIGQHKERLITISTLIALFINLLCNVLFVIMGLGLSGIAYSTSLSYAVNFFLLITMSKFLNLKSLVLLLIPFLYMIVSLYNVMFGLILLPVYLIICLYMFYHYKIFDLVNRIIRTSFNRR